MQKRWYASKTILFGMSIILIAGYAVARNPSVEMVATLFAGIGVIYSRKAAKTMIK